MPHLNAETIKDAFQKALGIYLADRQAIATKIGCVLDEIMDTKPLEDKQQELAVQIEGLQVLMGKEIEANTRSV